MKEVTVGSRWWAGSNERFVVIAVIEQGGHTWVHYRDDKSKGTPREYSCYLESFLDRFKGLPE
jgi:poly(3-hydroxybutyrate) depolymerase